ncbi:MAG: hypothetical protein AAGA25_15620 [Planctomycetota bacterium]
MEDKPNDSQSPVAVEESVVEYDFDNEKSPGEVIKTTGEVVDAVSSSSSDAASNIDLKDRYRDRLDSMEDGSVLVNLRHEIRIRGEVVVDPGNAFQFIFEYLQGVQRIFEDVDRLSAEVVKSFREAMIERALSLNLNGLQVYQPSSLQQIADLVLMFQSPMSRLGNSESFKLVSKRGEIQFSKKIITSRETNLQIFTEEVITEVCTDVLLIRKPDLLGNSMWDLIWEGRNIHAHISDVRWLSDFRESRGKVQAGSWIHARFTVKRYVDEDGKPFKYEYFITDVLGQGDSPAPDLPRRRSMRSRRRMK